jgi:DNA invertase Pin-like site-specific DNA recombinase
MSRSHKTQTLRPAVSYIRVSTQRQVDDGVSLDAQRSKIAAWCAVMGYEPVETYADEGISGHSMHKRPGLQQAIDAVCACGGVLVIYSLSRLARNTRETLELGERLSRSGADLVSLSENIDTTSAAGKMVFRMLAVLAEFERDQVSERTTMALQHKKTRGERVSGWLPYGKRLAEDGVHLEDNDAEQALIDTIASYRKQGLSLRAIVHAAAQAGLTSRAGTPLKLTQIARLVKQLEAA